MGASPRKDYSSDAIVKSSNKTMRRVNFLNTPESTQAIGSDQKHEIVDNYDDIVIGNRLLKGNQIEYVSKVSTSEIETEFNDEFINDPLINETVTTVYSKEQVEAFTFDIVKDAVNTLN